VHSDRQTGGRTSAIRPRPFPHCRRRLRHRHRPLLRTIISSIRTRGTTLEKAALNKNQNKDKNSHIPPLGPFLAASILRGRALHKCAVCHAALLTMRRIICRAFSPAAWQSNRSRPPVILVVGRLARMLPLSWHQASKKNTPRTGSREAATDNAASVLLVVAATETMRAM